MIFKPTDMSPQAQTFDVKDTPVFFECMIDSANQNVQGYSIIVRNSENKIVFPAGYDEKNAVSINYITTIDDLREYFDKNFSNYGDGYQLLNTGYNGSYLKIPFSVDNQRAGDENNSVYKNQVYFDDSDGNLPYIRTHFDNGGYNSEDILVQIYNGQEYKWQITLYQLEKGDDGKYKIPNNPWLYDMPITNGTILGSNETRIQSVYSDQIYQDYFIQPVYISNLKYDPNNPKVWTNVNNNMPGTITQGQTARVLIKSYDQTYGYIYPVTGDKGFVANTITPNNNNGFRIYKRGNDPENLTAYQQVSYLFDEPLDDDIAQPWAKSSSAYQVGDAVYADTSNDTFINYYIRKNQQGGNVDKPNPMSGNWTFGGEEGTLFTLYDEQNEADPGLTQIQTIYYVNSDPNGKYNILGVPISNGQRVIFNAQKYQAVYAGGYQSGKYLGSVKNGIYYPTFSNTIWPEWDEKKTYLKGQFVCYQKTGYYYKNNQGTKSQGGKTVRKNPSEDGDNVQALAYIGYVKITWTRTPDADSWGELQSKIVMVTSPSCIDYYGKNYQINDINNQSDTYGVINQTPFKFVEEKPVEIYKNNYSMWEYGTICNAGDVFYFYADYKSFTGKEYSDDNHFHTWNSSSTYEPGVVVRTNERWDSGLDYICIKQNQNKNPSENSECWAEYKNMILYVATTKHEGGNTPPVATSGQINTGWAVAPPLNTTGLIFYNKQLGVADSNVKDMRVGVPVWSKVGDVVNYLPAGKYVKYVSGTTYAVGAVVYNYPSGVDFDPNEYSNYFNCFYIKTQEGGQDYIPGYSTGWQQYWELYKRRDTYFCIKDGYRRPINDGGSGNWVLDSEYWKLFDNGRLYIRKFDGLTAGMALFKSSTNNIWTYIKMDTYNPDYNFVTYDKIYSFDSYQEYKSDNPSYQESEAANTWISYSVAGTGTKYQIKTFFRNSDEASFSFYTTPDVKISIKDVLGYDFIESLQQNVYDSRNSYNYNDIVLFEPQLNNKSWAISLCKDNSQLVSPSEIGKSWNLYTGSLTEQQGFVPFQIYYNNHTYNEGDIVLNNGKYYYVSDTSHPLQHRYYTYNSELSYNLGDVVLYEPDDPSSSFDRYYVKSSYNPSQDGYPENGFSVFHGAIYKGLFSSNGVYTYNDVVLYNNLYYIFKNCDSRIPRLSPENLFDVDEYQYGETYKKDDIVQYNGYYYISKKNNNLMNTPTIEDNNNWYVYPWQSYVDEVTSRTIVVEAKYDQQQHVQWMNAQWFLYDNYGNEIDKSGILYDGELKYTFTGLPGVTEDAPNYLFSVKLITESYNGFKKETEKYFIVTYNVEQKTDVNIVNNYFDCQRKAVVSELPSREAFVVQIPSTNSRILYNQENFTETICGAVDYQYYTPNVLLYDQTDVKYQLKTEANNYSFRFNVDLSNGFNGDVFSIYSSTGNSFIAKHATRCYINSMINIEKNKFIGYDGSDEFLSNLMIPQQTPVSIVICGLKKNTAVYEGSIPLYIANGNEWQLINNQDFQEYIGDTVIPYNQFCMQDNYINIYNMSSYLPVDIEIVDNNGVNENYITAGVYNVNLLDSYSDNRHLQFPIYNHANENSFDFYNELLVPSIWVEYEPVAKKTLCGVSYTSGEEKLFYQQKTVLSPYSVIFNDGANGSGDYDYIYDSQESYSNEINLYYDGDYYEEQEGVCYTIFDYAFIKPKLNRFAKIQSISFDLDLSIVQKIVGMYLTPKNGDINLFKKIAAYVYLNDGSNSQGGQNNGL